MTTPTPIEKITQAAYVLGCAEGVDRIGGQALLKQARISASTVNYQFGGRDGLISAVAAVALSEQDQEMRAQLDRALAVPRHLQSLSGFVAALAVALATQKRGRTLLLLELEPTIEHAAASNLYWRQAAQAFGQAEQAPAWEVFFNAVTAGATLDPEAVPATMWACRASQRFAARLERRADPQVASGPEPRPDDVATAGAPRHARAALIIEAAVDLLLEGRSITHRAVSEKAGVPLAATTYFFASRNEIALEAHREVFRRVLDTSGSSSASGEPFAPSGALRPSLYALQRLSVAAARDQELMPLAARMRGAWGRNSVNTLRMMGVSDPDRLDGLIYSLSYTALVRIALAQPPGDRARYFSRRLDEVGEALFGVALA